MIVEVWQPETKEIKNELNNIYACARLIHQNTRQSRSTENELQRALIDSRIRLLELHRPRMRLKSDQARCLDTIRHLNRQKTDPPRFIQNRKKPLTTGRR